MRRTTFTKLQDRLCGLLVDERREAGLTQREVARRLGVYASYVSKYENGERRLDVVEFLAVAEAIGFDPKEIFEELEE